MSVIPTTFVIPAQSENIDILITKRAGTTKACLRGASEQVKSAFRRATDPIWLYRQIVMSNIVLKALYSDLAIKPEC